MTDINHYRTYTDEMFKLFEAFKQSGFSKEEAFELVKPFSNQTAMDNVYSSERKTKADISALRRHVRELERRKELQDDI